MVYLDDVLIYSPTFEGHLSSLREVFSRIQSAGLRLKPKKCHLAQDHVCSQTLETQTSQNVAHTKDCERGESICGSLLIL